MCEYGLVFDETLFASVKRLGLAVSGGADSVALAHLLIPWCRERGIEAHILHVNHGWRGEASDGDEKFVSALAWQVGVPCHIKCLAAREDARPPSAMFEGKLLEMEGERPREPKVGISPEMAAREARQNFFAEVCGLCQLDAIATGHNAGDVAETLLLRLLRGAGAGGLGGLRPRSAVNGVNYIRPLLSHTHETLCEWLRARGFEWREDVTNEDNSIPRNLVRNRVLPWLSETFGHDVRVALRRSAEILGEEDALLNEFAAREDARPPLVCLEGGRPREPLSVASVVALPRALQRRIVRAWLLGQAVEASGFEVVERVLALLEKPRWRFSVVGGEIVCDGGEIEFRGLAQAEMPVLRLCVPEDEGIVEGLWGNIQIQLRCASGILREVENIGKLPARASLSGAALRGREVVVRAWQDGDRIQPLGMSGHRKVQDIFSDAKIPVWRKREIPVFCCGGEIVWIPGYRPGAAFAVVDERDAAHVSCFAAH